jgi:hypothetical protein
MTLIRYPAIAIALVLASFGSAFSADIISDWNKAATPPPPEQKDVTIDPATNGAVAARYHEGELRHASALRRCSADHDTAP